MFKTLCILLLFIFIRNTYPLNGQDHPCSQLASTLEFSTISSANTIKFVVDKDAYLPTFRYQTAYFKPIVFLSTLGLGGKFPNKLGVEKLDSSWLKYIEIYERTSYGIHKLRGKSVYLKVKIMNEYQITPKTYLYCVDRVDVTRFLKPKVVDGFFKWTSSYKTFTQTKDNELIDYFLSYGELFQKYIAPYSDCNCSTIE